MHGVKIARWAALGVFALSACKGNDTGGGDDGIVTDGTDTGNTATNDEKFDVEPVGDGLGSGDCDGGDDDGDAEFSYIWIANSMQGTVSKIDTRTGVELGRYEVRENSAGANPSRTSVNPLGDMAVSLRNGAGVTKIYAREERCVDTNGMPGIQTSTGPGDVKPWGEDECAAWHAPFEGKNESRAIAWTGGKLDPQTCQLSDVNVWVAGSNDNGAGTVSVHYVDGNDGNIKVKIDIPDLPESWPGWHTLYGGAVDADDNFWATQLENGNLIRIDHDDFTYKAWPMGGDIGYGGYGMTISSDGYVWVCGQTVHRFDPLTETWEHNVLAMEVSPHTGGCFPNGEGTVYKGQWTQILGIDTQSLDVVKTFEVAEQGDDYIWGVAVDFDGYVWGVPRNGDRAYKIDPETAQKVLTVTGLVGAYTYSDMTGFALDSVNNPPQG